MADIFVSYDSGDRDRIRSLVEALEAEGWSVWWDREIVTGESFDETIERALDAARCVVVAWSTNSIQSRWCRAEANEGLERGILVPLCIDDVRPPLAFRSSQTASLVGWPRQTGELDAFLTGVRRCLGSVEPVPTAQPRDARDFIAVLPFVNLSNDPEQSFFSDGVAEQILTLLSRNPELKVVSRSSSFWFKDQHTDIPTVVAKLGVTHVLEGSVMKAGDKVRITAQLIDGGTDSNLWSGTYDRTLDDIFAIQDEIAARVAEELNVALLGTSAGRTENTEAYLLVLQARHLLSEDEPENLTRVETLLDRALALDPDYVPALSELVRLRAQKRWAGLEPQEASRRRSRELVERVLEIDPDNALATISLAWNALEIDSDLAAAVGHVERAIALGPTQSRVLHPSAPMLICAGRIDDAIALGEHVVRLDPLSIIVICNLGDAYLLAERFDDATAQYENAIALHPGSQRALAGLGQVELLRGNAAEALKLAEQLHDPLLRPPLYACALFDSGRHEEAEEALAAVRNLWPAIPIAAFGAAKVYAWMNDPDNAFAWLERALDERAEIGVPMFTALTDLAWKAHRADPRWYAFLDAMGQSPEQLAAIHFELKLPA